MGNSSSDRSSDGQRDRSYRDGQQGGKEARPNILLDSTEDADLFQREDTKAPQEIQEFLAWQQDLESDSKSSTQARPTMFRWPGAAKEVFVSGSFNNWATKIPLNKSQKNFVAIVDLPEGEHQYKFCVDGQWTLDPTGAVMTSKTGTVNNVIQVKSSDFEVFDALRIDSEDSADMSAGCNDDNGGEDNNSHDPTISLRRDLSSSGGFTQSFRRSLHLSSSPPGPYLQEAYVIKPEDKIKHPPILPPHLLQVLLNKDTGISCDPTLLPEPNHVMLNHLYALSIKDGVMVLSATHRYKKKYVTTLLYKPI
uniref:Protein kinase, AMP-activated, beta 1 non-catalytic subunit, b n=1 Tax=Sander lucioperca TaxID=283035 RepID=A0A8C9ZTG7_SANLU